MSSFNPRSRTAIPAQVVTGLYRLAQGIQHRLRKRALARSLSPAQVQALIFLKYARPGVRTISGLAQRLNDAAATASEVADALERKGLIRRHPSPRDQRLVLLTLTSAGEQEVAALEDMLDDLEAAVAALPFEQQTTLLSGVRSLVTVFQQCGLIAVYEMCWGCQFFRPYAHPDNPQAPHHCAFVDAPLSEGVTFLECPDFSPQFAERR